MSVSKKRAAPKPPPSNGPAVLRKENEKAVKNGNASTDDSFIDKTVEVTVVLPNQSLEKIHIVPSIQILDLRTQLCGKYQLSQSSHKLIPVDGGGRAISFTPSSTVESTGAVAVHLLPKLKDPPKIIPIKIVEQTVRLTVKTSQSFQQCARVKPNVPLSSIIGNILEKTNVRKEHHKHLELRHPERTHEPLDLTCSLDDYNKLREVFVADKREKGGRVYQQGSAKKGKKLKNIFKLSKKKNRPNEPMSPSRTMISQPVVDEGAVSNGSSSGTVETPKKKAPAPIKQTAPQKQPNQDETLHGQVPENNENAKPTTTSEQVPDVEHPDSDSGESMTKVSTPPPRPTAPPRKTRAPVPTVRSHATGKKKAPAPPTAAARPATPTEQSSPPKPKPDKPPRKQSTEQVKEEEKLQQHEAESDDDETLDNGDQDAAIAALDAVSTGSGISEDDTSNRKSSTENQIQNNDSVPKNKKDSYQSEPEVVPIVEDDSTDGETEEDGHQPKITIPEVISVTTTEKPKEPKEEKIVQEERSPVKEEKTMSPPPETSQVQLPDFSDDDVSVSEEEQTIEEINAKVIKMEDVPTPVVEPVKEVPTKSSDDVSAGTPRPASTQSNDLDEHYVIVQHTTTGNVLGYNEKDIITEKDLNAESDSDVEAALNQDSVAKKDKSHNEPDDDDVIQLPPPQVFQEKELPPPVRDQKPPSPITAQELPPPPITAQEPPPPPITVQEPPPPPVLDDSNNLFTTPEDYNVYETKQDDMNALEAQALEMMKKFQQAEEATSFPPPPSEFEPTPSTSNETHLSTQTESKQNIEVRNSVENDEESSDDESKQEEIERLKEQINFEKQQKAQREAEAEYAKKNPYKIVPEKPSAENSHGKAKTFTFVPNQTQKKVYEDYVAAPQPVINLSANGEIGGIVTETSKKEKSDSDNEKKAPISPVLAPPSAIVSNDPPIVNKPSESNTTPQPKIMPMTKTEGGKVATPLAAVHQQEQQQPKEKPAQQKPAEVKAAPKQPGGYVNSAIKRQPNATTSKPPSSIPPVYDATSEKKSALPAYYKRFLGMDAVAGTKKGINKFKSNAEDKKSVPNGDVKTPTPGPEKPVSPVVEPPKSPTKPAVAEKPKSIPIGKHVTPAPYVQKPKSPVAPLMNQVLNPQSSASTLPVPPEEKSNSTNQGSDFQGAPLPPPPEEFLTPLSGTEPPVAEQKVSTIPSPTSPSNAPSGLSPNLVGISAAKPFGSSGSGGVKFRPMAATIAAFKSGKTKPGSP